MSTKKHPFDFAHRRQAGGVVGHRFRSQPSPTRNAVQFIILLVVFVLVVGCSWVGVYWLSTGDCFRAGIFGLASLGIFLAAVRCPWVVWE